MSNVHAPSFEIEVLSGPHQGDKFHLSQAIVTVGRGTDNKVCLEKDPRISRQHIQIEIKEKEAIITNLSSRNLMTVDEAPAQEIRVTSDCKIQIGESVLLFRGQFKSVVVSEPAYEMKAKTTLLKPAPSVSENSFSPPAVVPQSAFPATSEKSEPPIAAASLSQLVSQNMNVKPLSRAPRTSAAPAVQRTQNNNIPNMNFPPSANAFEKKSNKRAYIIAVVVLIVGFFFFKPKSSPVETVAKEPLVRNPAFVESDSRVLNKKIDALKQNTDDLSLDRKRRIDENMIRGLRDVQQGNYQRALESFLVVVSIDPENTLAKRNYHNAKIKLDEQVKYFLLQAQKYREKRNYRLCASNYQSAESLLFYTRDPASYKQAQQGREFCELCQQKGARACQDLK